MRGSWIVGVVLALAAPGCGGGGHPADGGPDSAGDGSRYDAMPDEAPLDGRDADVGDVEGDGPDLGADADDARTDSDGDAPDAPADGGDVAPPDALSRDTGDGDTIARDEGPDDDPGTDPGLAAVLAPSALDEYGGIADLPVANASGFFRPVLLGDRWVLATPAGHAFLSVGPTTVDFGGDPGTGVGYSAYTLTNQARWGSGDAGRNGFYQAAMDGLRGAGFTTVAGWSGDAAARIAGRRVDPMPYMVSLAFSTRGPSMNADGFPDVFDPRFADNCRSYAASATQPFRGDPWLIGYFTDNELKWWGEGMFWPADDRNLADDFIRLAVGVPGKAAWMDFLATDRGYADVAALNAAWGTSYATWNEVALATSLANDAAWPRRSQDKDAFVGRVARAYFETVDLALRAADPDHLDLCVRFATSAPTGVPAAAAPCDVLSINDYYSNDDELTPDLFRGTPEERWVGYALAAGGGTTPKPTMLTEFGLRAGDSMLPNGFGAGFVESAQSNRAAYYRQTLQRLAGFRAGGLGFVMGYHWFEYRDEPKTGRWDGEDGNYGLVSVDTAPYAVLLDTMASVHAWLDDRLLGGTAPVLASPSVRSVTGDAGPALAWDPVPGATGYRIRLSPAPWVPGEVCMPTYEDTGSTCPADEAFQTASTSWTVPSGLAAGARWAVVTAVNPGLAFASDPSAPVRTEVRRACSAGDTADPVAGCFANPAPMTALRDDGWARAAPAVRDGQPGVSLRFLVSVLGRNHPRNGGTGTDLVVGYEPPSPLAADALPRVCSAPAMATDGVREPAARFLTVRLKGADGSPLTPQPLDLADRLAADGCADLSGVATGPVARIEWVLPTGRERLPLDVPIEVWVGSPAIPPAGR